VVAATNKIEVLDEALLRAGRFDRRVFLTLPNKTDRINILKLYLKDKTVNINIENLANETSGFSSASLSALLNEALLCMIKREGTSLLEDDIEFAKQKVQFGKKQIAILSTEQKDILATYQAGKAYITQSKVNLFDEGISTQNIIYPSKTQLKNTIKKYLSGSVALEIIKNESYVVFETEIKESYTIAQKMVEEYKMEQSIETLIHTIKDELKKDIISNIEEVKRIRDVLLKDEVVF
ncbi:MAG: cell division protein FtsH, partial [Arcobacteraceae bacterium]